MNRQFFSAVNECSCNCLYCFSKWETSSNFINFKEDNVLKGSVVIYPNCDGNFFGENFYSDLEKIINLSDKKLIVSISTKSDITNKQMKRLEDVHNILEKNKGFIKVSYSFTCSDSINILEKNTLSFKKRIENVKMLCDSRLEYCTIIKPILPFVRLDEYIQIIDETSKYNKNYILGDLYVNKNTNFYDNYIKNKYDVEQKKVDWINSFQEWLYVKSEMRSNVISYINSLKCNYFESDISFLSHLDKREE